MDVDEDAHEDAHAHEDEDEHPELSSVTRNPAEKARFACRVLFTGVA